MRTELWDYKSGGKTRMGAEWRRVEHAEGWSRGGVASQTSEDSRGWVWEGEEQTPGNLLLSFHIFFLKFKGFDQENRNHTSYFKYRAFNLGNCSQSC